MKRSLDLVRAIAQRLESLDEPVQSDQLQIDGHEPRMVAYHCALMLQAGLIDASDIGECDACFNAVLIRGLTWAGHDFVDMARNDLLWSKANTVIREKVTSMAFDQVVLLLKDAGQRLVRLGWGSLFHSLS